MQLLTSGSGTKITPELIWIRFYLQFPLKPKVPSPTVILIQVDCIKEIQQIIIQSFKTDASGQWFPVLANHHIQQRILKKADSQFPPSRDSNQCVEKSPEISSF